MRSHNFRVGDRRHSVRIAVSNSIHDTAAARAHLRAHTPWYRWVDWGRVSGLFLMFASAFVTCAMIYMIVRAWF